MKLTLNDVGNLIDAATAQTTINNNNALIEAALENTFSLDGTAPNTIQTDIDMNSKQIYNLPAPGSMSSPARLQDVTGTPVITIPGTGTSGHVVPYLDGTNAWSGGNTFTNIIATSETVNGPLIVNQNAHITGTLTVDTSVNLPSAIITNANLVDGASSTVKGNIGSGTADLTATQLTTIPNVFTSSLKGLVPASSGGTTTFLRADSTFAALPSSVYNLINTLTASNSASLSDTTSITGTYSTYDIVFTNILPATNGAATVLQIHSGGAYKNTGYLNQALGIVSGGTSTMTANTASISLSYNTSTDTGANVSSTTPGMCGTLRLYNPSVSAVHPVAGNISYMQANNTNIATWNVHGFWNTAGVIDGLQFSFATGNISSGTIKIYGIT